MNDARTPLTRDIGEFLAAVSACSLPTAALGMARTGFIDCIAVMIAGRDEPAVRIAREVMARASGPSRVLLGTERTSPERAAWLNGVAAHVLDYDDVALQGHPSAVLVPALLALGDEIGASGERMLAAYVAGFEVWGELLDRQPDFLYNKGWHPTCVLGTPAAAAACAVLAGLDAGSASFAVAIAGSLTSGVLSNFGSMTKSLQVGHAAQSGVIAARLARAGFTGAVDAVEHAQGYLEAFASTPGVDVVNPSQLGRRWRHESNRLAIKQYPVCYCSHRAADGLLDLLAIEAVDPGQVVLIEARLGSTALNILRNQRPKTALEAKFSIEFAIAAALHDRRVGFEQLTDAYVERPDIQATMARVRRHALPDDPSNPLPFARADQILLHMADGRVIATREIDAIRGDASTPLSDQALRAKFEDCVRDRNPASVRRLFDQLQSFEHLPDVRQLGGAITPARAA